MRTRLLKILIALVALVFPAFAAPVGTLDISGVGNIFVTATTIDWGPLGLGWGNFVVTGGDGGFAILQPPPLETGVIRDLDATKSPAGPPLATPVDPFILAPVALGPPFPGPVPASAIFSFSLEQILLGGGPPCTPPPAVGQSCTPTELVPNSPFLLSQNPGAVTGSMVVLGTATDLRDGSSVPYRGLFSFNLVEVSTVPAALSIIAAGGAVESSWSAQLHAVPEPGTLALMGAALLAVGTLRKRVMRP